MSIWPRNGHLTKITAISASKSSSQFFVLVSPDRHSEISPIDSARRDVSIGAKIMQKDAEMAEIEKMSKISFFVIFSKSTRFFAYISRAQIAFDLYRGVLPITALGQVVRETCSTWVALQRQRLPPYIKAEPGCAQNALDLSRYIRGLSFLYKAGPGRAQNALDLSR